MTTPLRIPWRRLPGACFPAVLLLLAACGTEIDIPTEDANPPACQVVESRLDFGRLTAGGVSERTFNLRNIGGGNLVGTIAVQAEAFTIIDGGGRYSLAPGQIRRVRIRFAPRVAGLFSDRIVLGLPCRAVELMGAADPSFECRVTPAELDFGNVVVGSPPVDRRFTIVNIGGVPLPVDIGEPCDVYEVIAGGGSRTIPVGDSLQVTVRFQPTTVGSHTCLIETGQAACADVIGSGSAEATPMCDVSPAALSFGTVCVGASAERMFTITNTGTTVFVGNLGLACPGFSLVSGGGAFTLGPGQSHMATVRFEPQAGGSASCTIATGNAACPSIAATGTGQVSLPCTVTPASLGFGDVTVGLSADLSYTIENPGCAPFSGEVSAACPDFQIIAGQGAFTLGPGQGRSVTVRFQPGTAGPKSCAIQNGGGCPPVTASGTGVSPLLCAVEPAELDFGGIMTNATRDLSFTIRNGGGGVLMGTVSEDCPDFSIQSGGGSFNLSGNQTRTVTVRFQPGTVGSKSCSIGLGNDCPPVNAAGTGEGPPQCQVTPSSLSFGAVTQNTSADRSFVIRNAGGGTLSGNVTENCLDFSIPSGGGPFSLGAGESKTITVRFRPVILGQQTCGIGLGTPLCNNVACSGSGQQATSCQVNPQAIDFGVVTTGTTADESFSIVNTGGGTLTGNVSLDCPGFSIVSGGGAFSLGGGQSRQVTVRFSPPSTGMFECTIDTGTEDCADVAATTTAEDPPACLVSPTSLSFGTVTVGQGTNLSFTVQNTGGGSLTGNLTESCPDFAFVSNGGSFILGAGQVRTVTVRFQPASTGSKSCTIDTGTSLCPDVSLTGTAEAAPLCSIAPSSLAFGTVAVGSSSDQAFTITNNGGGVVSGSVSESCADFSIVSGGGAFNLTAGQSATVTVRFQPTTGGNLSCLIDTGTGTCSDVNASGTGDPPPMCSVSSNSLNFGTVSIGASADRSFTITNTGGQTLAGNVTESCAEYSIFSGGGSFSLTAGQSRSVTLRFQPASVGTKTCTVSLGTADCPNVNATGVGEMGPVCSLSTTSLNFGLVAVGSSADRSFTIQNTGGGTLTGNVTEACNHYSIVAGGGSFALGANQTRNVTVRFAPTAFGTLGCTVTIGSPCGNVSATGTGAVSFPRHVVPLFEADCASCHDGCPLPDFRIYSVASDPARINISNPAASRLLQKPTGTHPDGHGGGTIWAVNGPEYNTIFLWIQQGAPNLP